MARQLLQSKHASTHVEPVRIDKWLWAARFYKTRALASDAVKSGKVHVDGVKVKPGKTMRAGEKLEIRQGYVTRTIIVRALSGKRGPASQAVMLYQETEESIASRENLRVTRQAQPALRDAGMGRPTKRERRHIISFTDKNR